MISRCCGNRSVCRSSDYLTKTLGPNVTGRKQPRRLRGHPLIGNDSPIVGYLDKVGEQLHNGLCTGKHKDAVLSLGRKKDMIGRNQ